MTAPGHGSGSGIAPGWSFPPTNTYKCASCGALVTIGMLHSCQGLPSVPVDPIQARIAAALERIADCLERDRAT